MIKSYTKTLQAFTNAYSSASVRGSGVSAFWSRDSWDTGEGKVPTRRNPLACVPQGSLPPGVLPASVEVPLLSSL